MNVIVDLGGPADDAGIRGLVRRQAMPGRIQLTFAREPDFSLGCAVTGDDPRVIVARSADDGAIVGVACRAVRRVFLNGREQRVGYLGQLRVDERFRGRWLVSRGFSLLEQIDREDPLPAYLTAIVDGNDEATGVLVSRRRRSFPVFQAVAGYRTLALWIWRAKLGSRSAGLQPSGEAHSRSAGLQPCASGGARPGGARLKPCATRDGGDEIVVGSIDQLPEIVRFLRTEGARRQFFSVWTEGGLRGLGAFGLRLEDIRVARRGGAIAGVMALWDQTAYKQAVVHGYSGWLRAVAPLSRAILPRAGEEVRSAYASLICVTNDDAGVFGRLLREIYSLAASRRFHYLLVGLDVRDPLLRVAAAYPHVTYPSHLYLGSWSRGGFTHEQLDDRPAYVDIATL